MRKFLITLLVIVISANVFGQGLQVKSPESYAFEKFGNVPVNLYTGTIDLKIPIFTNDLVNVFLSYDSSGFVPHKKSDIAGMNWMLMAGGRITRSIKQVPDDHAHTIPNYSDYGGFLEGVRKFPYSNSQVYDVNNGGAGKIDPYSGNWYLGEYGNLQYETEPDVYNFNVMGLSGKFMIGNDGNVLVESTIPNIKVDLTNMKTYGNWRCNVPFTEIKITDGSGNQYFFGGDRSNLELYYPKSSPMLDETLDSSQDVVISDKMFINAFSLSKIIFSSGKTVEFNYVKENFIDSHWCYQMKSYDFKPNSKLFSLESYYVLKYEGFMGSSTPYSTKERYGLIKKSLLESIKFDNTEIKINYKDAGYSIKHYVSPNADFNNIYMTYPNETLIDNIQIFSNSILVQQKTFSYEPNGCDPAIRPFLKTVKDENIDGSEYILEYYDNYSSNCIPYFTRAIDHWGYFNNINSNNHIFPGGDYNETTGDEYLNNTIRDPNPYFYNLGQLKKIIYPTKGFTAFEYESPTYGKRLERNSSSMFLPILMDNGGFTGGSRIKKQYDFTSEGKIENEKEYKYTTNINEDNSSGILMHWPRYRKHLKHNSNGDVSVWIGFYNSNVNDTSLDSYNVGYSKVFEINKNKGVIEHNFYSYLDKPDIFTESDNIRKIINWNNVIITPYDLYVNFEKTGVDKSIIRGKVKSKIIYDSNMNILKKIEEEYTDNIDFNPNTSKDNNNFVSTNKQFIHKGFVQGYKRYLNPHYLKKQTETSYLKGDSIRVSREYYYDSSAHLNLSRENMVLSDNNSITKNYLYAEDNNANSLMAKENMTGVPLEIITSKNGKAISKVETIYPTSLPTTQTGNLILPLSVQNTRINTISTAASPVGEIKDTEVIYNKYDVKGNLLEYVLKPDTNGNGTQITIIWGYNQTQPIVKIEGATYAQIMQAFNLSTTDSSSYLGLEIVKKSDLDMDQTTEDALITELDAFRKLPALSNFQITTYTYNPLIGVTSITPPNGIREIYMYDSANRLQSVIDINGKILKEYHYNYKKEKYYNTEQSKDFYRNNCSFDENGNLYRYVVPANKYESFISLDNANQKALDDINANGQNMANINGTCSPKERFYNTEQSKDFYRNNCSSDEIGDVFKYVVPANKYESFISVEDANQKALNDINANGQDMANINGTCSVIDCQFDEYALIDGGGVLYWNDNEKFHLELNHYFDSSLNWYQGVYFGKIEGNCFSPNERTSTFESKGLWEATIKVNGDVYVKFIPKFPFTDPPANNTHIVLDFIFNF